MFQQLTNAGTVQQNGQIQDLIPNSIKQIKYMGQQYAANGEFPRTKSSSNAAWPLQRVGYHEHTH